MPYATGPSANCEKSQFAEGRNAPYYRPAYFTTEGHNRPGVSDLTGLASFFNNVDASSHFAVDQEGNSIRMVPDADKAWTQVAFNPQALSIEQIGFASTPKPSWYRTYLPGLIRTSQIVGEWSIKYSIPLRKSITFGVCQHADLGAGGGGHWDCGPGYPFKLVLLLAKLHKLRLTGKRRSLRARILKRRILRAQRRQGVRRPRTTL